MNGVKEKLANHKFALMVTIAVTLAVVLSGISVSIYVWTGAINIDLSRPGYEKNRVDTAYDENETPFSNSGPINAGVIEDFNKRLDKIQAELNGMNNFSADAMSDDALGL